MGILDPHAPSTLLPVAEQSWQGVLKRGTAHRCQQAGAVTSTLARLLVCVGRVPGRSAAQGLVERLPKGLSGNIHSNREPVTVLSSPVQ